MLREGPPTDPSSRLLSGKRALRGPALLTATLLSALEEQGTHLLPQPLPAVVLTSFSKTLIGLCSMGTGVSQIATLRLPTAFQEVTRCWLRFTVASAVLVGLCYPEWAGPMLPRIKVHFPCPGGPHGVQLLAC